MDVNPRCWLATLVVVAATLLPAVGYPVGAAVTGTGKILNPGLTGKFWFRIEDGPTYYTANARTGIETKLLNRPSRNHFLVPSPEGRRYLFHSFDTATQATDIDVYDSATRAVIAAVRVPGWVSAYRFSRDARHLGLLRSPSFVARTVERGLMVVDLTNLKSPRMTREFLGRDGAFVLDFDWLPDGRYIYLRRDRKLFIGSAQRVGGTDAEMGIAAVPSGFALAAHLAASPDGKQAAFVLNWAEGPLGKSDVWVANIDGTRFERLSNTGLTNEPMWSPDGRYIAMVLHTEHACQAGGCFGVCERWYAPSKARNISTGRTPVRVYEKSNTTPQGLWCERDVFWTR